MYPVPPSNSTPPLSPTTATGHRAELIRSPTSQTPPNPQKWHLTPADLNPQSGTVMKGFPLRSHIVGKLARGVEDPDHAA